MNKTVPFDLKVLNRNPDAIIGSGRFETAHRIGIDLTERTVRVPSQDPR